MGNGFEIDFLAVGDGQCSGDAIALRFGNDTAQRVVIIDGGTQESGQQLVDLVRGTYGTSTVDLVLNTHPDRDHSSGLSVVLEQLTVRTLMMHRPALHSAEVRGFFQRRAYLTDSRIDDAYRRSLANVATLEQLAQDRGVSIVEPFAGVFDPTSRIQILGPSLDYYEELLVDILGVTDTAIARAIRTLEDSIEEMRTVKEDPNDPTTETLDDTGETSPSNNSSAILYLNLYGHQLLFTGDAGMPALTRAADFADSLGIDLTSLRFLQVPHHGSRRNVGPTILNRIKAKTAYISAAKEGEPKHPSQRVVNALIRREANVYATQGKGLRHHFNAGDREGWSAATPLPFKSDVEDIAA